jgi:hypothetical protein
MERKIGEIGTKGSVARVRKISCGTARGPSQKAVLDRAISSVLASKGQLKVQGEWAGSPRTDCPPRKKGEKKNLRQRVHSD